MRVNFKEIVAFGQAVANDYMAHKVPQMGAALAYFSIFSLSPLLVIAIAIAGKLFGHEAAQGQVMATLRDVVGRDGADAIQLMILHARQPGQGVAALIGVVLLVMGATGVFAQLKDSLNTIWGIAPNPKAGIKGAIRQNLLSVTAVLGTGFLLMISLLLSAMLSAFGHLLASVLPGGTLLWEVVNQGISLAVTAGLFALMFKYLPDAKVSWKDVAFGAIATAVLFAVGKFAIGLYLGNGSVTSSYGAAGSLVALVLWVFYSAQILYIGAEFTQVYANRYGDPIRPGAGALPISEAARLQQGLAKPATNTPAAPGAADTERMGTPLVTFIEDERREQGVAGEGESHQPPRS